MRHLMFLALALLCASVTATPIDCVPVTAITPAPLATGSTTKDVETVAAEASAWWCPVVVNGVNRYRMNIQWNLKEHKTNYDWRGAFVRIKAAPDFLAALNSEVIANAVSYPPGSQKAFEEAQIRYKACSALATKPYLVNIGDLPADFCGPVPAPPTPSAAVWLTMNSSVLKVYANNNGKLGAAIPGRLAPPSAPCNSTVPQVKLGTSVYYPLANGPLNELYLCRLVQ